MAEFLRTSGISNKIEDINIDAQEVLVIVSPYLQISKNLFERLKEKSEAGIRIDFVYGKSELSDSERNKIESLKTIKLYFHENLHAKCYYNEQELIITSMNLYEFSEKNNREMGVLIKKVDDAKLYEAAVLEAKSIMKASNKDNFYTAASRETLSKTMNISSTIQSSNTRRYKSQPVSNQVSEPLINRETTSVVSKDSNYALRYIFKMVYDKLNEARPNHFTRDKSKYFLTYPTEKIRITIEPQSDEWKIVVRTLNNIIEQNRIYKALLDRKKEIQLDFKDSNFALYNERRFIVINIKKQDNPEFFDSNETAISYMMRYIVNIEKKIIPIIGNTIV